MQKSHFSADSKDMADIKEFSKQIIDAVDAKTAWFDGEMLPEMLENYRLLHTCVKTLYEFLLKKSLIKADPYKLDKKISDIQTPDTSNFTDNERSNAIGMRFSDYDSTLDFLCNYYKFSVSNLTIGNIKKLVDFNNAFLWNNFSANSPKANTRGLATLLNDANRGGDQISHSMTTDSISTAGKALTGINATLKELTDFQREHYKAEVRKAVFEHPGFDWAKAAESVDSEMALIRKNFGATMGKTPFYHELIDEICQEDNGKDKDQRQKTLLAKLNVKKEETNKKQVSVDTKDMIMAAIRALGAMPPQIDVVVQKLEENHDILESEHNSFWDKLVRAFKKAFNIEEKPLFYTVTLVDEASDTHKSEKVNYQTIMADLSNRSRRYAATATKGSPAHQKLLSMEEEKILDYVNNQIHECNKMLKIINALDDFFKNAANAENKSKIKGMKMETSALKNTIVKVNQYRAEYSAYVEEEAQLKKLGIKNE